MIAHLQLHHANGWRLLDEAEYSAPAAQGEPLVWLIECRHIDRWDDGYVCVRYIGPDSSRPNTDRLDISARAENWMIEMDFATGPRVRFALDEAAIARALSDTGEVIADAGRVTVNMQVVERLKVAPEVIDSPVQMGLFGGVQG